MHVVLVFLFHLLIQLLFVLERMCDTRKKTTIIKATQLHWVSSQHEIPLLNVWLSQVQQLQTAYASSTSTTEQEANICHLFRYIQYSSFISYLVEGSTVQQYKCIIFYNFLQLLILYNKGLVDSWYLWFLDFGGICFEFHTPNVDTDTRQWIPWHTKSFQIVVF